MWAALLVPTGAPVWVVVPAQLVGMALCAVGLGTAESLVARLRMRAIPSYVLVGFSAAAVALVATLWGRP
jgi:hypothetical protein